jgi:hypothetical protein
MCIAVLCPISYASPLQIDKDNCEQTVPRLRPANPPRLEVCCPQAVEAVKVPRADPLHVLSIMCSLIQVMSYFT